MVDAIESYKHIVVITDNPTEKEIEHLANWQHKNCMCKNYIFNCLMLNLHDVY